MHGVMGKPPRAVSDSGVANSKIMLMLLVAMTGVAPISLYLLVPALPVLATTFGRGISVAQMTVSFYMVGIACSQIVMGPLSDRFGRRPVLLAGLSLMVAASVACIFAESLPQLIAARFLQALGGATGMVTSRAFIRYMLCQVLASQIIFAFAGGGPYLVVTQMGRTSAEYGAWFATTAFAYLIGNVFCVRFAPRHSLEKLIWFGLALQVTGSLLNLCWSIAGINQVPQWLFGTQMIVMFANAFVMSNSAAGAISIRPDAAGTASGAMGFLQMGLGSLVSQFGAWLGGQFTTTLPLTGAIFVLSAVCASTVIFIVPRRTLVVSEELIAQAEEEESGML